MEEWEMNETIEEMELDETRRVETGRVETRRDGDEKPPAGAHTAGTLFAREYALPPRRSISLPARRRQSVFQLGHTAVGPLPGSTSGLGYSLAPRQKICRPARRRTTCWSELGTRHQVSGSRLNYLGPCGQVLEGCGREFNKRSS